MENQNQKWVNLSLFAFAALIGYVFFSLMNNVAGTYDLEARIQNIDLVIRAVSAGLAGLLFLILYKSERTTSYMNEVMVELSKVTWPTRKETYRATVIVLVTVLIAGMLLGGLDALWTWLLRFIF